VRFDQNCQKSDVRPGNPIRGQIIDLQTKKIDSATKSSIQPDNNRFRYEKTDSAAKRSIDSEKDRFTGGNINPQAAIIDSKAGNSV
jgi:hypothetical protein